MTTATSGWRGPRDPTGTVERMRATPLPPSLVRRPFRSARALELGVMRGRLGARDLRAPFRGVRAPAGAMGLIELCRAYAQRMPPGHVFSHATAARLWGLPLPDERVLPLHVSAPASSRQPRVTGVVGHRLGEGIRVARSRGLPVVAVADAWCQLATTLSHEDLVAAGDRIVGWPRPLGTLDEIDAAIERFGSRRGVVRLRAARADLRVGSASRRETRLRLAVLSAGFPEPELNGPIDLGENRSTPGDLVFRTYRVLLEYDGEQHRDDDAQFHRDVERLNDLAAAGWIVIRVGRRLPLDRALDQLERALRARGWRGIRSP